MQILGLIGMYFDAEVVFVTSHSLFFKLTVAILCYVHFFFSQKDPRGYAKVIGTKYYKHLVMIWYKK